MHTFYTPGIHGKIHRLDKQESQHCINVLRLQEDDKIILVDGKGGYYKAKIKTGDPHKCTIDIISSKHEFGKKNFRLHIAIAPTKNISRLEWFLEKATEIGIDEITPLLCERSERKTIRNERLDKVIVSAMKQSDRAYKPKLNRITKFSEFVSVKHSFNKFIAYCDKKSNPELKELVTKGDDILILIGPEGDFSSEEVNQATKNGFHSIQMGTSRLRTETAGIVACHTVNLINQ
ncbi:MAG: 16S rRNA (uracil(1498)-N(3))-methyltransferase [Bacteroidales bacterium]|nr:16S rRNA (uracil(1498)-N(3))-methyltransferase [Bacteroidales bacterium]